jgi:hypothetical protein
VWTHHGESVHQKTASMVEEEEDRRGDNRMNEMLDAIRPELKTNSEDPPTSEVQKIFDILRALEGPLHEHPNYLVKRMQGLQMPRFQPPPLIPHFGSPHGAQVCFISFESFRSFILIHLTF